MWSIGYLFGFIGAVLTLAANVFFVAYGYLESALPSLMLYAAMIPINAKKVYEIKKLVRAIEHAKGRHPGQRVAAAAHDAVPGQGRHHAVAQG